MTAEQFCAGCEYIRRISVWLEPVEYVCPAEFDPDDGALDGHRFDLYVTNDGEPEWMLRQLRGWRA